MAKQNIWIWVAVVAVVLVVFNVWGLGDKLGIHLGGTGGGGTVTSTTLADNTVCIYDGSTLTFGPVEKRYNPGTAVADGYDRAYINGIDNGLVADGSSKAVSFGDKIDLFYAANDSVYYAAEQQFNVPCKKTFTTAQLAQSNEYKLVTMLSSSTLGMTIFNADDSQKNGATQPDTVTVSSTVTPSLRLKFGSEAGLSPYGNGFLVIKYNSTVFTPANVKASSTALAGFADAAVPQIANNELAATGYGLKAFSFKGVEGATTTNADVQLEFIMDDTEKYQNDTAIYVYDEDWFQNSKTQKMEFGTQDDNNNDVGITTEPSVTYYGVQ